MWMSKHLIRNRNNSPTHLHSTSCSFGFMCTCSSASSIGIFPRWKKVIVGYATSMFTHTQKLCLNIVDIFQFTVTSTNYWNFKIFHAADHTQFKNRIKFFCHSTISSIIQVRQSKAMIRRGEKRSHNTNQQSHWFWLFYLLRCPKSF